MKPFKTVLNKRYSTYINTHSLKIELGASSGSVEKELFAALHASWIFSTEI